MEASRTAHRGRQGRLRRRSAVTRDELRAAMDGAFRPQAQHPAASPRPRNTRRGRDHIKPVFRVPSTADQDAVRPLVGSVPPDRTSFKRIIQANGAAPARCRMTTRQLDRYCLWGRSAGVGSRDGAHGVGAVFGSCARGDWGVGSDLDIVVVLRSSDVAFTRRALAVDATALPVPADVLVYTVAEWDAPDRPAFLDASARKWYGSSAMKRHRLAAEPQPVSPGGGRTGTRAASASSAQARV